MPRRRVPCPECGGLKADISPRCMACRRRREDINQRFWSYVDKSGDCWLWTGATSQKGYGQIGYKGKVLYAPRVAYMLTYGEFPEELFVLHRCDNPPCVNPAHLFLGTQADNVRDMNEKGRNAFSRRTHCKRVHELSGTNLRRTKKGRSCRTCANILATEKDRIRRESLAVK